MASYICLLYTSAGFEKVIFIIKKENEADFKEAVGDRMAKYMDVSYAYQELASIPQGYEVPEGRVKPWGTAVSYTHLDVYKRQGEDIRTTSSAGGKHLYLQLL